LHLFDAPRNYAGLIPTVGYVGSLNGTTDCFFKMFPFGSLRCITDKELGCLYLGRYSYQINGIESHPRGATVDTPILNPRYARASPMMKRINHDYLELVKMI
jgi:hypothetical protein